MVDRNALINRQRINITDVPTLHDGLQVVSPSVMRRPVLDQMLADASIVAAKFLHDSRARINGNSFTWEDFDINKFERICELVLKQTRLELAVEKHVEERASSVDASDVAEGIVRSMRVAMSQFELPEGLDTALVSAITKELGLTDG